VVRSDDHQNRNNLTRGRTRVAEVNKVAIRFKDGRVFKGATHDFMPGKAILHVHTAGSGQVTEVKMEDLKAVFFVKTFDGRPDYCEGRQFPQKTPTAKGRKIAVLFNDGELLTGYTFGYDPKRPGFFVMPTDEMCNNERVYVVRSAVREVGFGPRADQLTSKIPAK
jgi:hypothetical protein